MARWYIDCREYPSEMNCTLAISADTENYDRHFNRAGDLFFSGTLKEIRLAAGGMHGPTGEAIDELRRMAQGDARARPSTFQSRSILSDDFDLRSDVVRAAAEPMYWAQLHVALALRDMDRAAERIVTELDSTLE